MKNATFRQLKTFESVARLLNFTRAAEELHLSQPAISMQIKQLEDHAGMALFEQIGKKTFLTQAGEQVRRLALEMLSQVKDCEDSLASLRGATGGHLNGSGEAGDREDRNHTGISAPTAGAARNAPAAATHPRNQGETQ